MLGASRHKSAAAAAALPSTRYNPEGLADEEFKESDMTPAALKCVEDMRDVSHYSFGQLNDEQRAFRDRAYEQAKRLVSHASVPSNVKFQLEKLIASVELLIESSNDKPVTRGNPLVPRRAHVPCREEYGIDNFIEQLSQEAFLVKANETWKLRYPDLLYCNMHKVICEGVKCQQKERYKQDCTLCLREEYGGTQSSLFDSMAKECIGSSMQHLSDTWNEYCKQMQTPVEVLQQLPDDYHTESYKGSKKMTQAEHNRFIFQERSAFLLYTFRAWSINNVRVRAVQEHHRSGGDSSAFNLLPAEPNPDLLRYVQDQRTRVLLLKNYELYDEQVNKRTCPDHVSHTNGAPAEGHTVQVYNKFRYMGCAVCIKPREQSELQMRADRAAEQARALSAQAEFKAARR